MKIKLTIVFITIILLLPPILIFAPIIANYGKSAENTFLLGKDYSSLTREQIYTKLDTDFQLPQSLILKTADKNFTLDLASVSAQINKEKVASSLLYRRLDMGLIRYIQYFFHKKNSTLEFTFNEETLNREVVAISDKINKPFVPSELQFDKGIIAVKIGQIGQKLNETKLKEQIKTTLESWQSNEALELPVDTLGFLPTPDSINQTITKAQKLIGKNFNLTSDIGNLTLDDKTLISWLAFDGSLSYEDVNEFVVSTAKSLKRDPVNAVFKFEDGKVNEFRPALDGIAVDEPKLIAILRSSLDSLINSPDKSAILIIPVITTSPLVRTEDVNNLGIKELLGTGKSTFKHSSTIRNFNVQKGASIINRILVAPGEEFSFIKNLGEVTLEAGYKKAYIIRQGKTELDVGGGICQVSTTLFRAMLSAGLDITARTPHAYRVGYYEEDSPPGYDATVFIPKPDLKFKNDTGHYVLIQSTYDGTNKSLTYEIYGTSDGRKVEITNYRKWGTAPPPPDVWIDDPTLPPGKVVQDEHRIAGLKTAFDWKVTRNTETLREQTFQSYYVPWAAVYRRGI